MTEHGCGVLRDVVLDVVPVVPSSRILLQYEQIGNISRRVFTSASAARSCRISCSRSSSAFLLSVTSCATE